MYKAVQQWVNSCVKCAKRKRPKHPFKASMIPMPVEAPIDIVAMNLLGPLPVTKSDKRHLIVFFCLFTRWVEASALKNGMPQQWHKNYVLK